MFTAYIFIVIYVIHEPTSSNIALCREETSYHPNLQFTRTTADTTQSSQEMTFRQVVGEREKDLVKDTHASCLRSRRSKTMTCSERSKRQKESPLSESNKGPSDDNRTITVRRSKPTELRRD
jgi:hypothetical protein